MTRPPVVRVICSHRVNGGATTDGVTEIVVLRDRREVPYFGIAQDEADALNEIRRAVMGYTRSKHDHGLRHIRDGVTWIETPAAGFAIDTARSVPDGQLWRLRCPECPLNVEVSAATLHAVLDVLYRRPAGLAEEPVELAFVVALVSRRSLLP